MKDLTLKLSGSVCIGEGDIAIHNSVRDALAAGYQIIILDMEEVTYLDSAAVGELVAALTSAKNRGCDLALTNLPEKVRKTLATMAFLDLFGVYDSTEDAKQIMRRKFEEKQG